MIAGLGRRLTPMQRRADADLRRLGFAHSSRIGLRWMLRRLMPEGTAYLNIGHSNLSRRVLRAARDIPGGRIAVFIHDTIPLDFPEFQREGTPARFRHALRRVGRYADLLIFNSARTEGDVRRVMARWNLRAEGVVAHLGVDVPRPDPAALPAGLPTDAPYYVVTGTIEPRKNIRLLLDVWDDLAAAGGPVPGLMICGARGWRNEDVFARLDALPPDGPVRECPDLGDPALAALIRGARALLQPSLAEGFGLPPVEAAALETPVVCSDLPVFHEILGDIPVYLNPQDRVSWAAEIKALTEKDGRETGNGVRRGYVPPSWQDHFNIVLRMT
ncbi:glycosyltransferase family 4 protein [Pseudooceanicola sp. LIPI14-2-Ac024]|uniref:glycosyltransferase family 4 protein n=1 Tax=Pseudooceanicola sp. LIPI14-2-Ac024 TaxID=3344875 RepID=UPI0035D10987